MKVKEINNSQNFNGIAKYSKQAVKFLDEFSFDELKNFKKFVNGIDRLSEKTDTDVFIKHYHGALMKDNFIFHFFDKSGAGWIWGVGVKDDKFNDLRKLAKAFNNVKDNIELRTVKRK